MDKVSLVAGIVVVSIILGVYFSKVPITEAYMNGAGKLSPVTEQQYSAEYLYKNRPHQDSTNEHPPTPPT